ncbi:hypothetical protein ACKWTF_010854 [Chironomus riparius]
MKIASNFIKSLQRLQNVDAYLVTEKYLTCFQHFNAEIFIKGIFKDQKVIEISSFKWKTYCERLRQIYEVKIGQQKLKNLQEHSFEEIEISELNKFKSGLASKFSRTGLANSCAAVH